MSPEEMSEDHQSDKDSSFKSYDYLHVVSWQCIKLLLRYFSLEQRGGQEDLSFTALMVYRYIDGMYNMLP